MPAKRYLLAAAIAAVLGLLSCVDGDTPTGVEATGVARLAIIPTFSPAVASTAAQAGEINRIRVTATKASDGTVLVVHEQDVDPNAAEWTLEIEVPVPEDGSQVILTIELIHVEGGQETVEWSGQTAPVSISAGASSEARAVEVVRGPTANLGVTSVVVIPDTATIDEADTVRITAQVATTAPEAPVVFWASLDSTASVAGDGLVTGLLPGLARIVAVAGGMADTANVTVLSVPAGVVVTPDSIVVDSAGSMVTFAGAVVDARGDSVPGEELVWASRDTTRVESLGSGLFQAFGAGESWIEARAVSDTALVDSALVTVIAPEADLVITKVSQITEVSPGDTIEFLITVQNLGPDRADAFRVVDHAPEGLAVLSDSVSAGTSVLDSLLWRVDGLDVDSVVTWTVRFVAGAEIAAEPIAFNSVEIDQHETFDPDGDNNSATYELSVFGGADVGIEMTIGATEPRIGDRVTVEIAVTNYGPLTARNIRVVPILSPGLELVEMTVDVGDFDPDSNVWKLPELDHNQAKRGFMALNISDPATAELLWEITASSRHEDSDSLGFDYNPENDTTSLTLGVAPALADIQVIKTVDRDTVTVGDHATFLVQVINHGPGVARGIVVRDSMDAGLTPVVVDSTHLMVGRPDSLVADSIAVGDTAWASLTMAADSGTASTTLWNRAWVIARHRSNVDPDSLNNADSASVYVRQTTTDLEILKTVSQDTAVVGDSLLYEVRLINHGPRPVDSVVVVDFVDEWALHGIASRANTFARVSTVGSPTGDTLVSGTLAAGDTALLRWVAFVDTVAAGDTIWNEVSIESVFGAIDTTLTNNNNSVWTFVTPWADLSVMKWVDDSAPFEGDSVTFTVVVENFGPGTATSVRIQEVPDSGFSEVALVSLTGGVIDTLTGIWSLDSIPSGVADTVTLRMTVDSGTVADTLWNRAWSLGLTAEVDPDATNDTASASVVVDQKTLDIGVLKSIDNSEPYEGDTIKFTVVVDNFGPDSAANVQIQERLDSAGLTPVGLVVTNGTFDTLAGKWDIGPMGSGTSDTLVLTAVVDSGTVSSTLWNRAFLGPVVGAVETDPANNADSASVTVGQRQADLALHKFVDDSAPFEGDTITYFVELQNFGTHTARNVQVFDSLSAGLTQLSETATRGVFDLPTRTWTVDSIAPGETDTLALKVRVDSGTVAQTLWNRVGAYGLTHAVETDPLNDTVSVDVTVDEKTADLNLTKTADRASAQLGDTINYTVVLENWGSHAATGVVVVDTLPSQLTLDAYAATLGSYDPASHAWTVGTLPVGGADTLSIQAHLTTAVLGDSIRNIARVRPLTAEVDTDLSNNADTVTSVTGGVDVQVTKTTSTASPAEGESFVYTIVAKNIGTVPAVGVQVKDTLPTGVDYVSHTAEYGTYSTGNGNWSGLPTLNPGDSTWLTITVVPPAGSMGTALDNIAYLIAVSPADLNPANNSAQASATVTGADYLKVTKTASKDTLIEGDSLTYEVSVVNLSAAVVTNVVVNDTMPMTVSYKGTRLVSPGTTYDTTTGDWDVGTMNPGDSLILQIWGRPDAGVSPSTPVNIAFVKGLDQTDTNAANDTAQVSSDVTGADFLQVTKTASKSTSIEGDTLTYTVSVLNPTVAPVTGVMMNDTMPTGVTFGGEHSNTAGGYDPVTGDWGIGMVNPGDSAVLSFWVTVNAGTAGATLTNIAFVEGMDHKDTIQANNSVQVSTTVTGADYLQITKIVNDSTPLAGDTIAYKVIVQNIGPGTATGVQVYDTLPGGLSVISGGAYVSEGLWQSAQHRWTSITLDSAEVDTLKLDFLVTSDTINNLYDNRAWALSDLTETNTVNDTMTARFRVARDTVNIAITKSVSNAAPKVGDTITYTVGYSNYDSRLTSAGRVFVYDTIQAGLTFLSASTTQGSYDDVTGAWDLGYPPDSTDITLTIDVLVDSASAGVPIKNVARLQRRSGWLDANQLNDTAAVVIDVDQSRLQVTKSVNKLSPQEGDSVVFTITVMATDTGNYPGSSVEVKDLLPAGFTYANSSVSNGGTYNAGAGIWTLGLSVGTTQTLQILANVDAGTAGSTIKNVAELVAATPWDGSVFDNRDSVLVTPQLDLSITKSRNDVVWDVGPDSTIFHIQVHNHSYVPVTNLVVRDSMTASLSIGGSVVSAGTFNAGTGIWSVPSIPAQDSVTLTIQADYPDGLTAGDSVNNWAWIVSTDQTTTNHANDTIVDVGLVVPGASQQQEQQQEDRLDFAYADHADLSTTNSRPGIALPSRRDEVTTTRRSPALHRPRRSR